MKETRDCHIIFFVICVFNTQAFVAQQRSHLLFFKDNLVHFNPAHSGVDGRKIQLSSRSQWIGIEDAPANNSLSYISKTKKNVTWGYHIETDRVFIENKNSLAADYAYRLKLDDRKTIHLGVRVGLYSYSFDVNELVRVTNQPNEILSAVRGYIGNIIGAGIHFADERENAAHFFSLSIPNVVSIRRFKAENGITTEVSDRVHSYLIGGSKIKMGDRLLIPHFLIRHVQNAPLLFSFLMGLDFQNKFELGFGLTNNDFFSGYFSLKKMEKYNLGIGYEFPGNNGKTALRKGTLEFNLIYKLGGASKEVMEVETISSEAID